MQSNVVPIAEPATFPIEPYEDIVIIEQLVDDRSAGGLILPGGTGEYASGRVVAVGPGRTYSAYFDATGHTQFGFTVPTKSKVGDYVIFGKYQSGGEPIIVDGKKYLMAREGDIGGRSASGAPIKVKRSED